MLRVTIWNEFVHERTDPAVQALYPRGIHEYLAGILEEEKDLQVRTATLDMPEQGLSESLLAETDVLIWWSHIRQEALSDEAARRVQKHVQMGMGLIALHSAHFSKPMRLLMGTSMTLRWRHGDRERLWCTCPSHPIAQGIPPQFEIPREEMYGEYFDIPKPDDVVFTGWFSSGEVFRSGCTFTRGQGKIFYFQPGHEEYPVYHLPLIQQILKNAVRWAAPAARLSQPAACLEVTDPLEP